MMPSKHFTLGILMLMIITVIFINGCIQLQKSEPIVVTGKTEINRSGTYILTDDISCTGVGEADSCIGIWSANDVVLDCQGHTINGYGQQGPASSGIFIVAPSVKIRNCNIQNSDFGIFLKSDNSIFTNNTISNNGIGVYLDDMSEYNDFANNKIINNSKGVVVFMRSSNNTFINNGFGETL